MPETDPVPDPAAAQARTDAALAWNAQFQADLAALRERYVRVLGVYTSALTMEANLALFLAACKKAKQPPEGE